MQEVIKFIFILLNKHRIIASVAPENLSSIRLVRKLNFRKEAHFKQSILANGNWIDDLIYAILRSEWSEVKSITSSKSP
jgi:RimJ/RimL family protein N-acetyltransferase